MSANNNEKFIIFITTLAAAGLAIENITMGWDFWVPVVILSGLAALWAMNLSGRIDYDIRQKIYFGYAALLLFYHGIHRNSFFDTALAVVLAMSSFTVFNNIYMLNSILAEYFVVLFIHLTNISGGTPLELNSVNITRLIFDIFIVILFYYISLRTVNGRIDDDEARMILVRRFEANDAGMEDFLTNISHELRTPVNVVNGMSDLLIKKGTGYEAESIRNAGVRLANQIEDIQDFTECRRQSVFLEEDNYMSTSLINDVVTSFRMNDSAGDLEMVVDLDPNVPTMMRGDIKKLHKIFRHLLENAIKFTRQGGILVRMYSEKTDYGINLMIEVTDTGTGMDRKAVNSISEGLYQANKKRNRSSGGIGLGLFIVYGFAHRMGGFVKIESEKHNGTTVRVTVPQTVIDESPCLAIGEGFNNPVLFHVRPDKYKVPKLREFYRSMASNLATGIRIPLYSTETINEVGRLQAKLNAKYIFMGQEEYDENRKFFDELARKDIVIAVSADPDFRISDGSRVILMPKPLYAYPIIKILNEGRDVEDLERTETHEKPVFNGVKALIVDDESMNIVVATMLFREYGMDIDNAGSGREAIQKFRENDYDIIFMDHMMPEMDGVEAMKQIKAVADDLNRDIVVVALTANVVSGAREMFIREGFDGFIAKPIDTADFERVMLRTLSGSAAGRGGEKR